VQVTNTELYGIGTEVCAVGHLCVCMTVKIKTRVCVLTHIHTCKWAQKHTWWHDNSASIYLFITVRWIPAFYKFLKWPKSWERRLQHWS